VSLMVGWTGVGVVTTPNLIAPLYKGAMPISQRCHRPFTARCWVVSWLALGRIRGGGRVSLMVGWTGVGVV
jgi:hypothetical protein